MENETKNLIYTIRGKQVIDIEDYLTKPMAIYPMQPFPHFYWFAIEGKRPNIPENFIRNENQNVDINNNKMEEEQINDNVSKDLNNDEEVNKINEEINNEDNNKNKIKIEEEKKEEKKINY